MKPSVPHILVLRMERPMAIRIDYFRKGQKVAAVPFLGSGENSLDAAANAQAAQVMNGFIKMLGTEP